MLKSIAVFLSILVVGCNSSGLVRPDDPIEALRFDIDRVLADSTFIATSAGIKVQSLKSNEVLFERQSQQLYHPASNLKLLTSAAGLGYLGTSFAFRTEVLADSIDTASGSTSVLTLKGYGNPDFSTADVETLAAMTARAGVRSVWDGLNADVSYFDSTYWGVGWMWDDEPDTDEMFITPLSVNKNAITVRIRGSLDTNTAPVALLDPPTSYVTFENLAKTRSDSVRTRLTVTRPIFERSNAITVSGDVLADTSREYHPRVSVWRPELYTLQLFREALERRGITVAGDNRVARASLTGKILATQSQRFDSMLVNLNKISDNLSAENLLRTMAAEKHGVPGTAAAGISLVHSFLAQFGIDTTRYWMVDGSGVSHYNVLTADLLVRLLAGMSRRADLFPLYYASLPIAGVDGTLQNRMKGTAAENNVHAKTGSLSGVSSVSGYATTRDGEMLAFSILMQNFIGSSFGVRAAQDRICTLLARFSRHSGDAPP